ncbi:hypothetical protein DUNSADRAFT_1951 [Dunaliella salina]|uniref:Kinesin light chain n=1 Tax=Dunaliella salina TaxID=3046 RepID=A0ABQ7GWE8_DUNSA|nr:hypothetical protein DUNSADRAFT_1951 [Dunaliella salina]|eukprot:KAF5838935.1 hypothetical protein DUNSADRAFT_1951 [Dunaliella salina]
MKGSLRKQRSCTKALWQGAGRHLDQTMQTQCMLYATWQCFSGTKKIQKISRRMSRRSSSSHPKSLKSINNHAQGRHSEAADAYKEVLAWRQKNLGPDHEDTLDAMDSLAYYLRKEGSYAEAEALYRDLVKLRKQTLGQHEDTISALNGLSSCLEDQGNLSKAEELYGGVVAGRRKVLVPDDANTMNAVRNLAIFYWNQDRFSEAEDPFRELLAWHQKASGAQHQDTLNTMDSLAFCLEVGGNNAEAQALRGQMNAIK